MKLKLIKEILSLTPPCEVRFGGWVRTKRTSKVCTFVILSDGSCHQTLQCVVGQDSVVGSVDLISTGAALEVEGILVSSPGRGQSVEVHVKSLKVLGPSAEDYPLQKKGHSLEFLREIAHLRARTQTMGAVMRVRHVLSMATHEFFSQNNFFWVHTPILTASDGEGAGDMFQVSTLDLEAPLPQTDSGVDYGQDFFHKKTHLTVTGQLEAEFLALSLGRVYTFGPTFRAENSHTRRHLAEFWMIEPEMAFADFDMCLQLATDHVTFMLKKVLSECQAELEFFASFYKNISLEDLQRYSEVTSFPRISYDGALPILRSAASHFDEKPPVWGEDLAMEHERFLAEQHFKSPVWVTDYPKDLKAFYMRMNGDGKTVACMDLLVPGVGELIGGSAREERLEYLERAMASLESREDLRWYQDLRKYGSVPHGGYGLGLERMVSFVTGMSNVRDTIAAPRTPGNLYF